jgi:hypothetical protein
MDGKNTLLAQKSFFQPKKADFSARKAYFSAEKIGYLFIIHLSFRNRPQAVSELNNIRNHSITTLYENVVLLFPRTVC